MGDSTHTMTVGRFANSNSGRVYVPVEEQREQGICIDDLVEVTIHDVGRFVDTVSFEGHQRSGDSITVPAELVREVGLDMNEEYPISFEKVEEVDQDSDDADPTGSSESDWSDERGSVEDDGDSGSPGTRQGVEDDSESVDTDEVLDDLDESTESSDEGLGELFG